MLDVKRMRVLREVAAHGSFSAAAEALYLTQSAVSQQIAALERETGTPLLHRTRGGVRPTEAGALLVEHADAVLARLDAAERELASLTGMERGRVRIASFPSAGATLVAEAVPIYASRHPGIDISLAEAEPPESLDRIRAGEFDLVLAYTYDERSPVEDFRDLAARHLMNDETRLLLPSDHPLASAPDLELEDLAEERWIAGCAPGPCHEMALRTCRSAGFEPQIAFESNDNQVVLGLVASGVGAALMPELAFAGAGDGIVIRSAEPHSSERRIWAVTATPDVCSPATNEMVELLSEVASGFAVAEAA